MFVDLCIPREVYTRYIPPDYLRTFEDSRTLSESHRNFRTEISRRPVGSVGRAPDYPAGGLGFEPQTGPTLRVLK